MSINIKVGESKISIRRKGMSLMDFQSEKKRKKKSSEQLFTYEIEVLPRKSSEKNDEKKRRNNCSKEKDIVKKKERSRRKLLKFEKRYKYLENICYEIVSPKDNQNKSLLQTKDSKSTKHSVTTLLELTQQVLQLEEEVNAVLSSKSNSNNVTDDDCDIIEFLMKLNKVKKRLLDEFDLNLSDDSRNLGNRSISSEFQNSSKGCSSFLNDSCGVERTESASSRLDLDERMIDLLTEDILRDLDNFSSKIRNRSDGCKQMYSSNSTPILTDIPKIPPSFSRNSLLYRQKPPANLTCKNYEKLDIDFTIHELSAIYEVTDSGIRKNQTTIASLK